jgi:tRNA 5-methylaminomethyl-2-thiouridine biosynthesis bifunctional protein
LNSVPIIVPAPLAFDGAGVPWSTQFGDIYHSAESGPGQARHVFLDGNQLPARWRNRQSFTVLETGFGLGLNFLASWQAWREDREHCARLHYVAVEKHPFTAESLESLHGRYGEFASLSAELRAKWPALVPGVHRIALDEGRVLLTLALGDAGDILPRLAVLPDAVFLDGFAPARNPAMWSPTVIKAIARIARPGMTLATYTSAASVRRALADQGFDCEKRPGFGHKREMLCATFAPKWPRRGQPAAPEPRGERHALVIGAGLAGAAICERLASRGWRLTLIDTHQAPARGASGLSAGVFHPHVSPDDCLLSRLSRNAFLLGLTRWQALADAGHRIEWSRCGMLHLPQRNDEEGAVSAALASLAYGNGYAKYVTASEASGLAACRIGSGGCWYPGGGWLRSPSLVAAQLAAADAHTQTLFGQSVHRLERRNALWHALAEDGSVIATAPVAILANAADASLLADLGTPLRRIRGQMTWVPQSDTGAPRVVVSGRGYALPPSGGTMVIGSTYETEDVPPLPAVDAHAANLARLARLLPDLTNLPAADALQGETAFRAVARDRLPLIGSVPDIEAARRDSIALSGAQLAALPRLPDLYCATGLASRGIIWSALAGELLASLLEGEPLPLETDLAAAIDPGRFVLRSLRHGRL